MKSFNTTIEGKVAARLACSITAFIFLMALLSCGGGGNDGGSDDNDRNVTGTWSGALTKISDTCSSTFPQTFNFNDVVTQNISAVKLVDSSSIEYLGNLVGDDGFSVDTTRTSAVNGQDCQDARRVEYDSINEDDDNTSDVDFSITRTCGAQECVISYSGTASRTGTNAPVTTPGATVTAIGTTTPIVGGCPAMNPATNTGTYSGNGGCGISDAAFRKDIQSNEQVIVLEPFGANGATTFVVNSANLSTASSRRTDLTIKDEAGYSCSMTCSPPGTFMIFCTKEGSDSCTEKF